MGEGRQGRQHQGRLTIAAPEAARLLSEPRGLVLVLTISNPRARNALAPALYPAAVAALRDAAANDGIGAVVLTGEGEHFCGGGNLNRLRAQRALPPDGQIASLNALHEWVMAMRACPKPVLAAVEGAAAGGGFSVCLACDLIVAAEDEKFVMSYVKVGMFYPINPNRKETQGFKAFPSLAALPEAPEVAIIAVPGDLAVQAVDDCAASGVKVAIVMASGFAETSDPAAQEKARAWPSAGVRAACASSARTPRGWQTSPAARC